MTQELIQIFLISLLAGVGGTGMGGFLIVIFKKPNGAFLMQKNKTTRPICDWNLKNFSESEVIRRKVKKKDTVEVSVNLLPKYFITFINLLCNFSK